MAEAEAVVLMGKSQQLVTKLPRSMDSVVEEGALQALV